MTKNFRRFLFYFFLLAFLVITPLLSLYAAGYKFSSGFKIQKTGLFVIESQPANAYIYLNDKIQKKFLNSLFSRQDQAITTPVKIKGILPGEYEVRLEKNGYWPWQKKLKIDSGQTSYAQDIILFKKDIPLLIVPNKFKHIAISPNEKIAIGQENDKIWLIDLSGKTMPITSDMTSSESVEINWLNSGRLITNALIFDTNKFSEPVNLASLIGKEPTTVKWNEAGENQVYYLINSKLFTLDYINRTNQQIIGNHKIVDFQIKENLVYFMEKTVLGSSLNVWDLETNTLKRSISLPTSDYKFINPNNSLINLYDQRHKILLLIDPFSPVNPLKETMNNVYKAHWIDNERILYTTGHEIWLYNIGNFQKTLLTRLSDDITDVFWHPTDNYIIYSTLTSLNVLELDNRDRYNITTILKIDIISSPYLSQDGNTMYFYGEIGNQAGLFKLALQ